MVLGGFLVGRDLGGMGRANRTQCVGSSCAIVVVVIVVVVFC